ncbi:MAG: peptidase T [Erysipelotrichaceae bacterium]|jgi:tripeptide aminopeptidase|nr:peptidase T [Erysipelotrichaceae bacterium]
MTLLERFLNYVKIDTQSDHRSPTFPSTEKQKDLGKLLLKEMKELGIKDARMDDFGNVYGSIPANLDHVESVGFIAHMDTAEEVTGKNVNPRIIENYDGSDIELSPGLIVKKADFERLAKCVGKTIIHTDGTTLLGADDKAGCAEIMVLAEYLLSHPEVKHGEVKIGFTCDEEIGRGADHFDIAGFGADFAYTIDGGEPESLCYENFNAAAAQVTVTGVSIHPGAAKDKMISAYNLAMEFHGLLPTAMRPEHTSEREGFNHLTVFNGTIEEVHMTYIIRNHDRGKFEAQKQLFVDAAVFLNKKYQRDLIKVEITDSYYNMLEGLKGKEYIIDYAKKAIEAQSYTPKPIAMRGGTDGARLTYMGLPCPNLPTGGFNAHGRLEMACLEDMEVCVEIMKTIVALVAQGGEA